MRKKHANSKSALKLSSPPTIFGGDRPNRLIPAFAGMTSGAGCKPAIIVAGMTVLMVVLSTPINAESIDVSTQLPSPQGKYQKLSSTDTTTLATDQSHNVGLGIGTTAPDPSAILDLYNPSATGKGLLIPRISTGEPAGLPASYAGFIYYDTNNTAPIVHQTKVLNGLGVFSPGGVPQLWELQSPASIHIRNKNTKNIGIGVYSSGFPGVAPNYELTVQGGLFLTSGTVNSTTVSGAGARIMWVPSNKAFRVGQAKGGEWDVGNLGDGSFSAGYNETFNMTVKGTNSYSMGTDNKIADLAPTSNAIAIGTLNTVNGNNAISLGTSNSILSGATNSITIGYGVNATAPDQLVIGSSPVLHLNPPSINGNGVYIGMTTDGLKATLVIKNRFAGIPGYVGIGTDTPQEQLHVMGNIRASDLVQASDVKLKTDIEPFGLGYLEKIKKVEAVSFKWDKKAKAFGLNPGKKEIGVIAQQLETVFPELVQQVEDYKYVNYTKLNVMLVQALNELAAENNRLRQRFEALKKESITS